jgi:hypothetical protein
MIDLETLGIEPDSVIVSIGAVTFTEAGIEAEAYWPLRLTPQNGRHVNLQTIQWWMTQSEEARAVFATPPDKAFTLSTALVDLAKAFDKDTLIWSHGANFDEVLLADAYRREAVARTPPWTYKNVRCFRTVKAQYPDVEVPAIGTAHNALDDARYQAQVLLEIVKQKGFKLQ